MKVDEHTGEIQPHEQQGMGVEASRAMAESQAGFVIAKRFPRDRERAKLAIMRECESIRLAEEAEFSFPKGGGNVHGPTIRLLEVIAQNWGNITTGIRELEELEDESVLQAYCYDLETNTREERIFRVKHYIKLKSGDMKYLDDPRDLYELKFNMGSRRKRACMENVIPRHIIDQAVEICRETVATKGEQPTEENIGKMIAAFAEIGVTEEMLELRQQKKLKALTGPEFRALKRIYKGIDDGYTTVEKVFGEGTLKPPKAKTKKAAPAKKKAAKKKKADPAPEEAAPAPPGDPEPPSAFEEAAAARGVTPPDEGRLPIELDEEEDDDTMTDRIEVVKFVTDGKTKKGNPWKLYEIETANGTRLGCFDKGLVKRCEDAMDQGQLCEFEYEKTDKGLTLVGLDVIG